MQDVIKLSILQKATKLLWKKHIFFMCIQLFPQEINIFQYPIQYLPFYKLQWSIVSRYSQIYVENFLTYGFKLWQKKRSITSWLDNDPNQSLKASDQFGTDSDNMSCENIYIYIFFLLKIKLLIASINYLYGRYIPKYPFP